MPLFKPSVLIFINIFYKLIVDLAKASKKWDGTSKWYFHFINEINILLGDTFV